MGNEKNQTSIDVSLNTGIAMHWYIVIVMYFPWEMVQYVLLCS